MNISNMLRAVASSLNTPVIVILLILVAAAVVLIGTLIVELFTERRHLKVKMPELMDALRSGETGTEECILQSGLLKTQKAALVELTKHPDFTPEMREALAIRLLEEEKNRFDRRLQPTDLIAKLGPMFGLLGTLIPLGPGLIALGQGDTYTLSLSLLTAFDTTIVGLISAAAATLIGAVRKAWYGNYMSILEALTECVLEVEKEHVG